MLKTSGKAAVIHPTGTGKSFIAFKLCEDNPNKKVCWLSPSEYIFQVQVKNWRNALEKCTFDQKKQHFISDPSALEKENNKILQNISFFTYAKLMRMTLKEISKIQPDYIILDEFHRCGASGWSVGIERLLEVYKKVKVLGLSATNIRYLDNQRDMAWELFDGNIASELTLGEAIARGILPVPKYVLSIYSYQNQLNHYNARVRQIKNKAVQDKAEQQLEVLRRTLEQADGLDVIFAKYIIPEERKKNIEEISNNLYTEKEIRKSETKKTEIEKTKTNFVAENKIEEDLKKQNFIETTVNQAATDRDFDFYEKAYGKYLVFCANYDHLNEMKELASEWFARVDAQPHIYTVYSEQPEAAQEFQAFQQDSSSHLKLLYCIDMLNEGIHLEEIDGVILLRPTVSPTIYKQQIGRALAAGKKKQPIIFDIVMNIENLYSIGAVEEELREAVLSYRAMGKENELVNERFQIVDEIQDCRKLFTQLNETLGASWDMMYAMAKQYFEQYGTLEIPKRYRTPEGYSLGMWLTTQRKVYAGKVAGNLSKTQMEKLEKIGMKWQGTRELAWEKHYKEAVEYYNEHGHLLVGIQEIYNKKKEQDNENKESFIEDLTQKDTEKKEFQSCEKTENKDDTKTKFILKTFSTEQNLEEETEQEIIAQEKKRKAENEKRDASLARWLARLRLERKRLLQEKTEIQKKKQFNQKKKSVEIKKEKQNQRISLTPERIAMLNKIGMVWDAPNYLWEQYFAAAEKYDKEYGNLDVPAYYVDADGIRLGRWITKQRRYYKEKRSFERTKQEECRKEYLTEEQEKRLTEIGMIWEQKHHATWEKSYAAACRYYNEHGNLDMPASYITEDGFRLGRWVRRQRETYREEAKKCFLSGISAVRIKKLEQIGMIWETKSSWERRYQLAETYYKKYGNLQVPADYVVEGVWLGRWVWEQKARLGIQEKLTRKVTKPLTLLQKEKLSAIGLNWNVSQTEQSWQQQYTEAEKFYQKYGNLSIPKRYVGANGKNLGVWLSHQREGKRKGSLAEWQVAMMERIGMVWEFDDPWETGYKHAKEYFKEYGNLEVPYAYSCKDNYRLGKWISNQRCAYKGNARKGLTIQQVQKLEALDMVWSAKQGRVKSAK